MLTDVSALMRNGVKLMLGAMPSQTRLLSADDDYYILLNLNVWAFASIPQTSITVIKVYSLFSL